MVHMPHLETALPPAEISGVGWCDRRVADGEVPENIRTIAGWKKAMRDFMAKDAKLQDVVVLFTQKFVQMGQSKNFTVSTLMDMAWTVLIITWEAVVDSKLPKAKELEQGYKLRYEELQGQMFKLRESYLKEIAQFRDDRRRKQNPLAQAAVSRLDEMEGQDVFHFLPEDGLDPQTREYFKAAIAENLKMAITRGAAAAGEEVSRMAKELERRDVECKSLKGQLDNLETKVESLEIELKEGVADKVNSTVVAPRRSVSLTRHGREASKPGQTKDEIEQMIKQLETAKIEEARLLEKVNTYKVICKNTGIDVERLSDEQLREMTKEPHLEPQTCAGDDALPDKATTGGDKSKAPVPRSQRAPAGDPTTPGGTPMKQQTVEGVDPAALRAAEAQVQKLQQQSAQLEAQKQEMSNEVQDLHRQVEKLKKDLQAQKSETAAAVKKASESAKASDPAEEREPSKPTQGSEKKRPTASSSPPAGSEKPQKPADKRKTGLPPPDSAPVGSPAPAAENKAVVERLEAKCKGLEEQVKTLQVELQVAKTKRPSGPVASVAQPGRSGATADDVVQSGQSGDVPEDVQSNAESGGDPVVVDAKKPAKVASAKSAGKQKAKVAQAASAAAVAAPASQKKDSPEGHTDAAEAQSQVQNNEQAKALLELEAKAAKLESQLQRSNEAQDRLKEENEELMKEVKALKQALEEMKVVKEVMEKSMTELRDKFMEMREKLEENGVDVSIFDKTLQDTGMAAMINKVEVFERLYRDAFDRKQNREQRRRERLQERQKMLEKEQRQKEAKQAKEAERKSRLFGSMVAEGSKEAEISSKEPEGGSKEAISKGSKGKLSEAEFSEGEGLTSNSGSESSDGLAGGRRHTFRGPCPNCGWVSSASRCEEKEMRVRGEAISLLHSRSDRSLGAEPGADGHAQQAQGWGHDGDHSAASPSTAAGYELGPQPSGFPPFPERTPSRRKHRTTTMERNDFLSSGAAAAAAAAAGNSPYDQPRSVPRTSTYTGGLARATTMFAMSDTSAVGHEDSLALIAAARDPAGYSIVGTLRPGSGDSGSSQDMELKRTVSAGQLTRPSVKDAAGHPFQSRSGVGQRVLMQAGLQQFGTFKSESPYRVLQGQFGAGGLEQGDDHPMQVRGIAPVSNVFIKGESRDGVMPEEMHRNSVYYVRGSVPAAPMVGGSSPSRHGTSLSLPVQPRGGAADSAHAAEVQFSSAGAARHEAAGGGQPHRGADGATIGRQRSHTLGAQRATSGFGGDYGHHLRHGSPEGAGHGRNGIPDGSGQSKFGVVTGVGQSTHEMPDSPSSRRPTPESPSGRTRYLTADSVGLPPLLTAFGTGSASRSQTPPERDLIEATYHPQYVGRTTAPFRDLLKEATKGSGRADDMAMLSFSVSLQPNNGQSPPSNGKQSLPLLRRSPSGAGHGAADDPRRGSSRGATDEGQRRSSARGSSSSPPKSAGHGAGDAWSLSGGAVDSGKAPQVARQWSGASDSSQAQLGQAEIGGILTTESGLAQPPAYPSSLAPLLRQQHAERSPEDARLARGNSKMMRSETAPILTTMAPADAVTNPYERVRTGKTNMAMRPAVLPTGPHDIIVTGLAKNLGPS